MCARPPHNPHNPHNPRNPHPARAVSLSVGDWIFTALAWVLLAIGVLGLAWALLWDRARGRRRCPGCWYGLDGVPEADGATTCPECGTQTSNPRRLFRTRRRWGLAVLALVALAGAFASHAYPIVRDHGWWRIAPDVVLIALVPRMEGFGTLPHNGQGSHPFFEEAYWRRATTNPSDKHDPWWSTGGLWPWERWLLRRQSLELLESASTPRMREIAARLLAISTDDPVPLVAQEHEGVVVLAWSKLRYENCGAYTDIGVAVRHDRMMIELGYEQDLSPEFFLTAFERGERIHQETCQSISPSARRWSHRVSWRGPDGQGYEWWSGDKVLEPSANYFGAAPTSHVWDALDPTESWSSFLDFFFDDVEMVGVEAIRGRPCYHVRGTGARPGDDFEVWIDRETGLVRQQFFSNTLLHYEPVFDAMTDDSWHVFDPEHSDRSPLMQRLDEIDALLPEHDLLEPIDLGG